MTKTNWTIPELLNTLKELSQNYWWSWSPDGPSLFRDLDPELWESSQHNPRRVLEDVPNHRLTQVATDPAYLRRVDALATRFRAYMADQSTWANSSLPEVTRERPVAYFCAEFGLHESLQIYSGGLGVLAGDHLKSASDLGIPLVAIGLLYREGYFRQSVSRDGYQLDYFVTQDFDRLPIARMEREDGSPLTIAVPLPGRDLVAQVWRVDVGRVRLFLLDADVPENSPADRQITARLYGGDRVMRMSQEILLGVGGIRALRALGVEPSVYHLNEGHSAFLTLELARELVAAGRTFAEAREEVRRLCVFTTHTPVPAGHDEFPADMVAAFLGWMGGELGLTLAELMALGASTEPPQPDATREDLAEDLVELCESEGSHVPMEAAEMVSTPPDVLGVTPLALRMSRLANGVSEKHGEVSRAMWQQLFPGRQVDEVPIGHVTNGVHLRSWIAPLLWDLYDKYLGQEWPRKMRHPEFWRRVHEIPDADLWSVHQMLKERLVAYARHRMAQIFVARGESPESVLGAYELFDPRALTIGFARRFATYKRGDLIFRDPDRLAELLGNPERPVQILFAGKAHPNDGEGKAILRHVVEMAREPRFARWIVFLEDYDINVARHLVRGVDVWLNNPRRPLEASGTSGEKVALNGGLNLSVLDGWWIEGYDGRNGWAVGGTDPYMPHGIEDEQDAESLYSLLTNEVVPRYYDRGADGVPHAWVSMMKHSLETLTPVYNTDRMLVDYAEKLYAARTTLAVK